MLIKDIKTLIESQVPPELAIDNDFIGFMNDYDLNQNVENIKIFMDLYPKNDNFNDDTLILTHHKPLFIPKTPTYVLHSNWDVIDGGANEALAETLNLEVIDVFDENLGIGRICNPQSDFVEGLKVNFKDIRVVGDIENCKKVAIISGFGLKNPEYIKLAKNKNVDTLISGDLTQQTAILAINNNLTLIDLGHHNSEVPGLFKLKELFKNTDLNVEVINQNPWKSI